MPNKKSIIILIILLVIAFGAIFLYKTSYQRWPWQKEAVLSSSTPTASPSVSGTPAPAAAGERKIIMEDVAQTIAAISPVKPVLGGHWFVDRFWFVVGSDSDFYVEYEDGHILRRVLLEAQEKETGLSYQVAAYFESGESDWILKTGQDTQFGKGLDLYEYDQDLKSWVKKN